MADEKRVLSDREYAAKFLREGVASRIRRIRDLADTLEREAKQNIQRAEAGEAPFAKVPADFEHEIMTALFNLHISSLITTAAEGDAAPKDA